MIILIGRGLAIQELGNTKKKNTMVLPNVYAITFIVLLLAAIIASYWYVGKQTTTKKVPIPFKESMDLLNVPVVTFINNGCKLHFLLDTGGDYSYIDQSVLPVLTIKEVSNNGIRVATANGSMQSSGMATLDISYMEHTFTETFVVSDLKDSFEATFGSYGITVHGVLGSGFFTKYKYELNFENFTAYSKK